MATLLRRITSTRYIFLLSGLSFVFWSLATTVVPESSTLSALLQMDLDQSLPAMRLFNATTTSNVSASTGLSIRPHMNIGVAHTQIYVISLVDRRDRRDEMERLRTMQDLTWTVIDATPRNATLVRHILDRVALQRAENKEPFRWPEEINALSVLDAVPLKPSGSDVWTEISPLGTRTPDASTYASLPCAIEDDVVPMYANDTPTWMVLSPAKIACWHSHIAALRRFVELGHDGRADDVAIILEDDIDMEKDISAKVSQLWPFLPPGWDIVFLGHCWSDEAHHPSLTGFTDANVYPSHDPKCTHAYALSRSGARRLLQHLRHPPFAYSRALDQAYAWLVRSGRLRAYSVVPSLVVQRKSGKSDIAPGFGSEWRDRLRDGMFQA